MTGDVRMMVRARRMSEGAACGDEGREIEIREG